MSGLATCPECGSTDVDVRDVLADGRHRHGCEDCEHTWLVGEPSTTLSRGARREDAERAFAVAARVDDDRAARVAALKVRFLADRPRPQPEVAPYWARYQRVFSERGLDEAAPEDFHAFANSTVGAAPGNMSVFNTEWNRGGPEQGAARVRESVRHLLHGPPERPLDERLGDLLQPGTALGMTGWKESLLTKVLCVVHPDRFLPILTYSSVDGGKKTIARRVYGLELPAASAVGWHAGRLAVWSNDLLLDLVGEGFETLQHASQFLWWAKDQEE